MERFKKIFIVSVMFVTVLSMSVVVVPEAKATASAGDLIKMAGLSSVYYLAADGKRYVFPNESTYFSWYSDFSGVVTIPQSELESYPLGANVTVRPGTKLVKITTNPKVYAVTSGGTLVGIPDEATASTLYGSMWNKRIVDVPDAFFTNYKVSSATVSASAYPQGSLVKYSGSADTYYTNADGTVSKIANEAAFIANRFKWADVISATISKPTSGADITGAVATLTDTSSGAGGSIGAGTGLTVALSSDTPASATIIADATTLIGQASIPFVKVNFTAAADGDVKVTNLKFKRVGISSDTSLDSLYLYEGATRLTDASSISSNYTTFNNAAGLFTVTKGTTKTITLVGDLAYNASSGGTIGFNLIAATDVTTNGATVSGSFPLASNLMSTAVTTDLGKVAFSNYNLPTAANTSITPANDQEVWKFTMTSTNQELKVEKLRLTAVGSVQLADLRNFKLVVAGSQFGSTVAAMESGNVVTFDLSANPLVITKGGTKVVSLRADIVNGSTREFYFSFQNQHDITVRDASYNVYTTPYTSSSFSILKPTSTNDWYIAAGSLSISRATNSPTTDVAVDATSVTLGIFDFTASGEDMKVQNLNASTTVTTTNSGLQNAKIYLDDVQVGTTKNLTAASAAVNFTFGSTFIVKAGTTAKVKIVADVKKAAGTSYTTGSTVKVAIAAGSSNVQSMTSLTTGSYPSSDVNSNTLNITAGALTVTKYSGFANQTVVAGTNDAKLGSFVVAAGVAEGVTVSSITINLDSTVNEASTLSRMYIKDHATGAVLGDVKSSLSTANNYAVNFTLAASANKVIDLYGDVKANAQSGSWTANADADGSGVITGTSVSADAGDIQTITIGSGSLTTSNGTMPDAAILLAGSTGNHVAQYTFSASNEGFTVDKLKLTIPNNFSTSTAGVTIKYKNRSGVIQQTSQVFTTGAEANATATFTGLTLYVPADDDANLDVYVDMVSLSSSGASGANGAVTLDANEGFNATGDSGTTQTTIGSGVTNKVSNTFYNRKSKPTFAKQALSGTPTTGNPLYKFTVVADSAGNIEIKQLGFTVSTNGCEVNSLYLYDPSSSTQLTDTAVSPGDSTVYGRTVKLIVGAVDDDVISVSTTPKTYEVRGTVTEYTAADSDSVTVQFRQDTTATTTEAANDVRAHSFNVWSDRSASAHTTATADWTGGYLLKNMGDIQQLP